MRIIAGERRGLQLNALKGLETRPTSDKVKESVFNMIGPFFDGGVVVELFGGSGALSLEAISRGASEAIIFERNKEASRVISKNIDKCRYNDRVHLERTDAQNAINYLQRARKKVDFLFIDPPYAEEKYYHLVAELIEKELISETAIIVCEHDKNTELPLSYHTFEKSKNVTYGNIAISIYKK